MIFHLPYPHTSPNHDTMTPPVTVKVFYCIKVGAVGTTYDLQPP